MMGAMLLTFESACTYTSTHLVLRPHIRRTLQQPVCIADEDWRRRSPGQQTNFVEQSTAEFKRPYGTGRTAGSGASRMQPAPGARDFQPPAGYGDESPMPGREREYREREYRGFKGRGRGGRGGQGGRGGRGGPYRPSPIDEQRRRVSPGLQNNFYDLPSSDFKRPVGMDGGGDRLEPAGRPPAAGAREGSFRRGDRPPGEPPMPRSERRTERESGAASRAPDPMGGRSPGPLDPWRGFDDFRPSPSDAERQFRSPVGAARQFRSPSQSNFADLPTAEFKRPYGVPRGAPPQAPFIDDLSFLYGAAAGAGVLSNAIVWLSLYSLASTGVGLAHGSHHELAGAVEGASFVGVFALIALSTATKAKKGYDLPAGTCACTAYACTAYACLVYTTKASKGYDLPAGPLSSTLTLLTLTLLPSYPHPPTLTLLPSPSSTPFTHHAACKRAPRMRPRC